MYSALKQEDKFLTIFRSKALLSFCLHIQTAQIIVICMYMACAASFSFSIYLPYLRRALVTSQIICDVTDMHYDAKKPSASENFLYSNQVLARSSVTWLHEKCGKLNYNGFFPEPTYKFLDHPSNQKWVLRVKQYPQYQQRVCALSQETARFHSAPPASEHDQ